MRTPGPWVVLDTEDASGLQIAFVGGDLANEFPVCAIPASFPNIVDNANLIAEAPAMYEVIVNVLENAVESRYGCKEVTISNDAWAELERIVERVTESAYREVDQGSDTAQEGD